MTSPTQVRSLDLVLTARCNLKCSYCYQDDKNAKRMDWSTLKASVDLLLASEPEDVDLVFYGGEPLLELELIRQAVEYVEAVRPAHKTVRYTISTNGMLLDDEVASFFAAHEFRAQLSFDGVPEVQRLRGAATFERLDRLLDRLQRDQPLFFREQLNVNLTLSCSTIPYLADSVDYFLGKGLQEIDITPVFTHHDPWRHELFEELDRQFDRVRRQCIDHRRHTGELPLTLFRGRPRQAAEPVRGRTMCGVPRGDTLAVDVDGEVNGCVTLVNSFQTFSTSFLRDRARSMNLGDLRDAGFSERLALFPQTSRATGLFHAKQNKYSSYGRCGDCRYLDRCMVCPVSIGHAPDNLDPDRVPDFPCAYHLVSLRHQDLFPAEPSPVELLHGRAPVPELVTELMEAVRTIEERSS